MALKIISANTRGLRDSVKRNSFFLSLKSLHFHVGFLQECHLKNDDDVGKYTADWSLGPSRWSIGSVFSNGVGIIFKGDMFKIESSMVIEPGRIFYVDGNVDGVRYRLINVYAPTNRSSRLEMFKNLPDILSTNRIVVMGGDFNISLDGRGGSGGDDDFSAKYISSLLADFFLTDMYRKLNTKDPGHTWRNSSGLSRRLDYFFITNSFMEGEFESFPNWSSDHDIIRVGFKVSLPQLGPGFWKLNIRLLEKEGFRKGFQEFYKGWQNLKVGFVSKVEWWEEVKIKISQFCQKFSRKSRNK